MSNSHALLSVGNVPHNRFLRRSEDTTVRTVYRENKPNHKTTKNPLRVSFTCSINRLCRDNACKCFVTLSLSAEDRLEEALQCSLTYLLFHQGEESMTDNVHYYREMLGHDGQPREVSVCWSHTDGGGQQMIRRLGAKDTLDNGMDGFLNDGLICVSVQK